MARSTLPPDASPIPAPHLPPGIVTWSGANGHDAKAASAATEKLFGLGGNDTVHAGGGPDTIDGGTGDDKLYGEDGNDVVLGQAGHDWLIGGNGDDYMDGGPVYDFLHGGNGADSLIGGEGDDALHGDAGKDMIFGGDDNDSARGGGGHDTIFGEDGDDLIYGESGNDLLAGGAGNDRFWLEADMGTDRVTDFIAGGVQDELAFDAALGFDDWKDVMALAQQVGADLVFDLGVEGKLILENVALGAMTATDFALL